MGKTVCSLAGLDRSGAVIFRKRVQRFRLLDFLAELPGCIVAMEACEGAHHIGRFCLQHGHEPRLITPLYVRPYVKVHKNDAMRRRSPNCHDNAVAESFFNLLQRERMRRRTYLRFDCNTWPDHPAASVGDFCTGVLRSACRESFLRKALQHGRPDRIVIDGSHVRMFNLFVGVPRLIVPDNLKSGVNHASFFDPEINRSDGMMASHYGVGVLPARPRRPKVKAKVENGVRSASANRSSISAASRPRKRCAG